MPFSGKLFSRASNSGGVGEGGGDEEALPKDESVGGRRGLGHHGGRVGRGRRHRHRRPQGRGPTVCLSGALAFSGE